MVSATVLGHTTSDVIYRDEANRNCQRFVENVSAEISQMEEQGMKFKTRVVTGGAGFIGSHLARRLIGV